MLAPRDTATRERKSLDGLWRFALDAAGTGRAAAGRTACPPGRARCRCRPATTTCFPDRDARPRRRGVVRDPGAGTARLGRRADRAALRLGHPSRGGLGQRPPGRRARGRLHAVRGRRHRRREPGAENRVTVAVEQRADVAVDPAGLRRADPRRPAPAATSTTSSTTPACTGRSGCTPPRRRTSTTSRSYRPGRRRRDSRLRGRRPRAPTACRCASCCATPTAPRLPGRGGAGASSPCRTRRPWRPGEGYLYDLAVELWGGWRRAGQMRTRCRSASARSRSTARASSSTASRSTSRGFGKHEDSAGARQGPRQRVHGPRLRADGLAGRQLVPHLALPLRRGGTGVRRPPRHRRDRRDPRRRAEHGPGRRDLRRPELHDLLRGDHQRRHAGGARAR